jgi:hypothetical protein
MPAGGAFGTGVLFKISDIDETHLPEGNFSVLHSFGSSRWTYR